MHSVLCIIQAKDIPSLDIGYSYEYLMCYHPCTCLTWQHHEWRQRHKVLVIGLRTSFRPLVKSPARCGGTKFFKKGRLLLLLSEALQRWNRSRWEREITSTMCCKIDFMQLSNWLELQVTRRPSKIKMRERLLQHCAAIIDFKQLFICQNEKS